MGEMGLLLFVWNKLFVCCYLLFLGFCFRYYRNDALVALALVEVHCAVDESIQSVILTNSNAVTRIVLRAALANDDVAGLHLLATPDFHAKSLSCALATVLRTTYTFFMCHNVVPPTFLSDYLLDYYFRELFAVSVLLAIVLAALHLEDNHLVALNERVHNFYYNLCTFYGGCAYLDSAVGIYEQHFVKFNSLAGFHVLDVVNEELLALLYLELLTLNFYNCVHLICLYLGVFPPGGVRSHTLVSAHTDSIRAAKVLLFCELSVASASFSANS